MIFTFTAQPTSPIHKTHSTKVSRATAAHLVTGLCEQIWARGMADHLTPLSRENNERHFIPVRTRRPLSFLSNFLKPMWLPPKPTRAQTAVNAKHP